MYYLLKYHNVIIISANVKKNYHLSSIFLLFIFRKRLWGVINLFDHTIPLAILNKSTGFGSSFGTDAYMLINAMNKIPHLGFYIQCLYKLLKVKKQSEIQLVFLTFPEGLFSEQ